MVQRRARRDERSRRWRDKSSVREDASVPGGLACSRPLCRRPPPLPQPRTKYTNPGQNTPSQGPWTAAGRGGSGRLPEPPLPAPTSSPDPASSPTYYNYVYYNRYNLCPDPASSPTLPWSIDSPQRAPRPHPARSAAARPPAPPAAVKRRRIKHPTIAARARRAAKASVLYNYIFYNYATLYNTVRSRRTGTPRWTWWWSWATS